VTLNFLIVAFVLFLVVRGMVKLQQQEEAKPKPPETPADVKLLTEIRDLLAKR
jgi:large conductance mechanosensitive channel